MRTRHKFDLPIPKGQRNFVSQFDLAGTWNYTDGISKMMKNPDSKILLVPEPTNRYDKNAIKVVAVVKGWFGFSSEKILGYVPKHLTAQVRHARELGCSIRPMNMWVGDYDNDSRFTMALTGDKSKYDAEFFAS